MASYTVGKGNGGMGDPDRERSPPRPPHPNATPADPGKKKGVKKNPYICFCLEKKKEREARGEKMPSNIKDLIPMFGAEWARMGENARAPYKAMAAGEKGRPYPRSTSSESESSSGSEKPFWENIRTCVNNMTVGEIMAKKVADRQLEIDMKTDIMRLHDVDEGAPEDHIFVLIDFNIYCISEQDEYVPADVGLAAFSIRQGVINNYGTLIDPGQIPLGSSIEAMEARKRYELPDVPFSRSARKYEEILGCIDEFIGMYPTFKADKTYLFCLRDEFDKVLGCLEWLCNRVGVERTYYLYPYSMLVMGLTNTGRRNWAAEKFANVPDDEPYELGDPKGIDSGHFFARKIPHTTAHKMARMKFTPAKASDISSYNGIFRPRPPRQFNVCHPRKDKEPPPPPPPPAKIYEDKDVFMFESMCTEFLNTQDLSHYSQLSCLHHMVNCNNLSNCPLMIVNRHAYMVLDILVEYYGVYPMEGLHYPQRSSEHEMYRRRKILAMWGLRGFAGIPNFEDSFDFSRHDNVSSNNSVTSDDEKEKAKAKPKPKKRPDKRMISSSQDKVTSSDQDTGNTSAAKDSATCATATKGSSGYPKTTTATESSKSRSLVLDEKEFARYTVEGDSDTETEEVDDDDASAKAKKAKAKPKKDKIGPNDHVWLIKRFDDEDFPRVVYQPHKPQGRGRGRPSTGSSDSRPPPGVEYMIVSEEDDEDGDDELTTSSGQWSSTAVAGSGPEGQSSDSAEGKKKKKKKRVSEPPPTEWVEYPYYFDPILWSYGRGVKAKLPEEDSWDRQMRMAALREMRRRKQRLHYPLNPW